jgi:hemerythrin-like domain-containing protein
MKPFCARRAFLAAAAGAGLSATAVGAAEEKKQAGSAADKKAEEVSPGEDLMREHGVLRRILLIYGEAAQRMAANQELSIERLAETTGLVRAFVEDYHEKLEEQYLFPRFRKAKRLVGLVDVLTAQHQAGRKLTQQAQRLCTAAAVQTAAGRRALAATLGKFIRMYEPHAAREDTVLFPAFHEIIGQREYDALGDEFEKQENERFGAEGFEKTVARVEAIEKAFGLYDLAQYTPKM